MREFQAIFKRELRPLVHPVTGFDILEFDKLIPDADSRTKSLRGRVVEHYGERAADLVESLL